MRRIECPAGGWIGLPDEWLGKHARRHDEARDRARDAGLPASLVTWAASLAMLDDWGGLPGLDGNPESWDLSEKSWPVLAWISNQVYADLNEAMLLKKVLPAASPDGLNQPETMTTRRDGVSETATV